MAVAGGNPRTSPIHMSRVRGPRKQSPLGEARDRLRAVANASWSSSSRPSSACHVRQCQRLLQPVPHRSRVRQFSQPPGMARAEGCGTIASSLPKCPVLSTNLGTQCLVIGRLTWPCDCSGVSISPLFLSSWGSITGTPRTRGCARHTPRRRSCGRSEGS